MIIIILLLFLGIGCCDDEVNLTKSEESFSSLNELTLLKGGFFMTIWGSVVTAIVAIVWNLWKKVVNKYWTCIEISKNEVQIFSWLDYKMSNMPEIKDPKTNHLRVTLKKYIFGETPDTLVWLPQFNTSYRITFRDSWLWINRIKDTSTTEKGKRNDNDKYIITTLGSGRHIVEAFIQEAKFEYEEKMKERTDIWSTNIRRGDSHWERRDSRPTRKMDTVILPGTTASEIILDMEEFIKSEGWYYSQGIPYRRGYLLYGPPGTGKTSFITAVAGHLHVTICILALSNPKLTDEDLCKLMSDAPRNSIILLEDVDAAFKRGISKRDDENKKENDKGITFSGLLNAIDGVTAQAGSMLVMSTNHPEKLDPALIRPGRVDIKYKFGLTTHPSIIRFFIRFYQDLDIYLSKEGSERLEKKANKFVSHIPENEYSMAEIQGHLMRFRHDPKKAVEKVLFLLQRDHICSLLED